MTLRPLKCLAWKAGGRAPDSLVACDWRPISGLGIHRAKTTFQARSALSCRRHTQIEYQGPNTFSTSHHRLHTNAALEKACAAYLSISAEDA